MPPLHAMPPGSLYVKHRLGGWMPDNPRHFKEWLDKTVDYVRKQPKKVEELHASIKEFYELIISSTEVRMLFSMMFEQVPLKPPYNVDPTGQRSIRTWEEMLQTFDYLLDYGPKWLYNTDGQKGLVGFPFNAVLDWPMATPAGVSAFLRKDINHCFRNMLAEYSTFLASSSSTAVLSSDPEGWFSPQALQAMGEVASEGYGTISFEEAFICDPSLPAYGYASWDGFFTRVFRDNVRPIYKPNDDTFIANACESTPYNFQKDVKLRDEFWVKGQPYSLEDMLGSVSYAQPFVGGTIYQAFLSALSYHRWHAPFSGKILDILSIPGSYYAENYWEGFANIDPTTQQPNPDPAAPNNSQAYIAEVATRAVMFIQADDPRLGVVAIVMIGMAEVSTCEWAVKEGHISKGDYIGTFHFGGSTHCLVFQKGVELDLIKKPPYTGEETNLPVCGLLATILNDPLPESRHSLAIAK